MSSPNYTIPKEGSLGLLALGAKGLKAWREVRNGKTPIIEPDKEKKSDKKKRKVLVVGWDSADWQIINPLMDKGLMPTLESLVNKGVMGNIATLDPPLSPMLWSSIATGMAPYKHGILGFVEPDPTTGKIRPVTSTSRKVKAIWNILSQKGYKTHTVGWWPSYPAEPINGICVSNKYTEFSENIDTPWKLPNEVIYPETLNSIFSEFRIHPQELTDAHILPFIPDAAKVDQEKEKSIQILAKEIARSSSYHAAATWIMENEEWDFLAVYLDTLDHTCHSFIKFHPPQLPGLPDDYFNLYNDVVSSMYRYHDMMLERLVKLAGEDATIILLSDHGFYNNHMRPTWLPEHFAAPALEHRPFGVLCISGPGINKDERIYGSSIIDITPTILQLFDLEVGKDMEGKVLTQAFTEKQTIKYIDSWEKVDGASGMHPTDKIVDPWASTEALNQLIELGYVSPLEDDDRKNLENMNAETQFSLACSYIQFQKYDSALTILKELYQQFPEKNHFALRFAACLEHTGNTSETREIIEHLRKDSKNKLPQLDLLEGSILLKENKPRKALECLKKAEGVSLHLPHFHIKIGQVYSKIKRWSDAQRAFEMALKIDSDSPMAKLGLAIAYLKMEMLEDAANAALDAVGLQHELTSAHYYLGEALYKLGEYERAVDAFNTALSQSPGMKKAHEWLIKIYSENKINPALVEQHQAFIKDKIKGTVYVVSGLPRSGTSMLMQMLHAGGMPILTDNLRQNDSNNPKGYFEYEKVKSLNKDKDWVVEAKDKCVKVVSPLIQLLPGNFNYKIIFIRRDINEILTSQQIMLGKNPKDFPVVLQQAYQKYVEQSFTWMKANPNVSYMELNYTDVVNNPLEQSENIVSFLGVDLDIEKMKRSVDGTLYRNKAVVD
ncbi:MAG: alkaline phosphatase family protein [Bacteroidetes bacterium]|nr:alkaline phosphatase family protein [Bacteroidota bacterium]